MVISSPFFSSPNLYQKFGRAFGGKAPEVKAPEVEKGKPKFGLSIGKIGAIAPAIEKEKEVQVKGEKPGLHVCFISDV
jgi:hypothetical protein